MNNLMKNELRNCLEHIPESLTAFINRYDLLITNDELIDLINNSYIWLNCLFNRYYNQITIINIIFDVKFIPDYTRIYDELCNIVVKKYPCIIGVISPKYCTIYDELCKIAIKDRSSYINYINPKYCTIYDELCKIAVKYNPYNIQYINPEYCTIYNELNKGIG